MKVSAFLFFIFAFSVLTQAAPSAETAKWVERVVDVQTKEINPGIARRELLDMAVQKVSEDLIKEIIGEAKWSRYRTLIQTKIIKNSARYIPFTKPGEIKTLPEGFEMTMSLRVNPNDLQSLLLENGLFYETVGTPIVIPFLRWNDRVQGRIFAWWQEDTIAPVLSASALHFEELMAAAFGKINFYLQKPQRWKYLESLPQNMKGQVLSQVDLQNLAQTFGAQVLVGGEVSVSKSAQRANAYKLEFHLSAIQVVNGRVIAEVVRQFETESGSMENVMERKLKEVGETIAQDLAGQVLEAWQRGAFGASLYRLTVRGKMGIPNQELFKEALKNKVREIKSIKERLISANEIVYEVDSAIVPREILKSAAQLEFNGLKIIGDRADEKELLYEVKH